MRRSRARASCACTRRRSSCSSFSAAASLSVQARSVRVGDPSSELTKTSSRSPGTSERRASTSGRRSTEGGTCTVTSAYFAALRIVELRMVSEASFSFGITSRALSSVRMNVYISPISSTAPSTPPTSTQSPSRSGCVNAIISPATKFPSVRCEAKPMIRPRTADDASSAPATARTCGITSSAESRPTATIDRRDRAPQDAVARHRSRRAVGPHDPAVDQAHRDGGDGEDDPDHEQALPQLHGIRFRRPAACSSAEASLLECPDESAGLAGGDGGVCRR